MKVARRPPAGAALFLNILAFALGFIFWRPRGGPGESGVGGGEEWGMILGIAQWGIALGLGAYLLLAFGSGLAVADPCGTGTPDAGMKKPDHRPGSQGGRAGPDPGLLYCSGVAAVAGLVPRALLHLSVNQFGPATPEPTSACWRPPSSSRCSGTASTWPSS